MECKRGKQRHHARSDSDLLLGDIKMKTLKSSGGRFISADELKEIMPHNELAALTERVQIIERDMKKTPQ